MATSSSKAEKAEKKHKKRVRDDDEEGVRKHKKSKSDTDTKSSKKDRKKKNPETEASVEDATALATALVEEPRKKKRKEKEDKRHRADAVETTRATRPKTSAPMPFVTQTLSLYVPFFPLGFSKTPSELARDVLDPMIGTFSTQLRGLLLAYRKPRLSEHPVKSSRDAAHEDSVLLQTIDECAAGFAWLTAEMDLFCPKRGATMEGRLSLQSEGHIGLVCWDKFNASIEASRLPPGWTWVDTSAQDEMDVDEEDGLDKQGIEQLHSVGYWTDAAGVRVTGKLNFRIKDYQLFAGDHQYLSLEGTMLDEEAERVLSTQEREADRARRNKQNPNNLLRPLQRRIPDFSMTTIGGEDEDEVEPEVEVAEEAEQVEVADEAMEEVVGEEDAEAIEEAGEDEE